MDIDRLVDVSVAIAVSVFGMYQMARAASECREQSQRFTERLLDLLQQLSDIYSNDVAKK